MNRRNVLKGAIASAAALSSASAFAAASSSKLKAIRKAVDAGYDSSLQRIQDWVRLPTVAAEQLNIQEGADYMARLASEAGFSRVRKVATGGSPAVFGKIDAGAERTVGLYFMYDVKQYDEPNWSSPPLEPTFFDHPQGRALRGRGVINHKGPEATFLAALHAFRAAGVQLPVNLVLIAEGEEEIGSPNFTRAFADAEVIAELQRVDAVFMPTSLQGLGGEIAICLGAKGIIECELISSGERWGRGATQDIHSGFKASVDSPSWRLIEALSTLVQDGGNKPAIDGWFEHFRPLTDRERALIAEAAKTSSEAELKQIYGIKRWINDMSWREALEANASQPTVNIEGLVGGYTGVGGKTILPTRAVAKLDMRLVPDMTSKDCLSKLRGHLDKRGFTDIEIKAGGHYDPTETPEASGLISAEKSLLRRLGIPHSIVPRIAGSYPGYIFTGAPLMKPFNQFGLGHGGRAHAPDEFYLIQSNNPKIAGLKEATMGYVEFLYELASMS
ncbi:MAG TPA: M20/M25/M40 family metallo-hydrolase [Steroidobacteraceae bacterium]|nr:M20/M25/M40 family metallo-hydrolase [Steroidobacteraceae bacterium]